MKSTGLAAIIMMLAVISARAVDSPGDAPTPAPTQTPLSMPAPRSQIDDADYTVWLSAGWKWLDATGKPGKDRARWLYNGPKHRRGSEWSIWLAKLAEDNDFPPDFPNEHPFRVVKVLFWVNCEEESLEMRSASHFLDARGDHEIPLEGFSKPTSTPAKYAEPTPGTIGAEVVKVACPEGK